jgi:glycosyltransferase involved in cell wall biosynthesis
LSKAETFGLTIIEANACGTPAIVYNNTAQPELINGLNGLVANNGSVESVRECLTEVSKIPQRVVNDNCIKQAQEYTYEKSYNAYLQLMSSLLTRS